jgi:hypothetical protein
MAAFHIFAASLSSYSKNELSGYLLFLLKSDSLGIHTPDVGSHFQQVRAWKYTVLRDPLRGGRSTILRWRVSAHVDYRRIRLLQRLIVRLVYQDIARYENCITRFQLLA